MDADAALQQMTHVEDLGQIAISFYPQSRNTGVGKTTGMEGERVLAEKGMGKREWGKKRKGKEGKGIK